MEKRRYGGLIIGLGLIRMCIGSGFIVCLSWSWTSVDSFTRQKLVSCLWQFFAAINYRLLWLLAGKFAVLWQKIACTHKLYLGLLRKGSMELHGFDLIKGNRPLKNRVGFLRLVNTELTWVLVKLISTDWLVKIRCSLGIWILCSLEIWILTTVLEFLSHSKMCIRLVPSYASLLFMPYFCPIKWIFHLSGNLSYI